MNDMSIVGRSLFETFLLVGLAATIAAIIAAVGGFMRYTTRTPGNGISVFWLIRLGLFVGLPFGIVGIISGYMAGLSRESAIGAIVPAALTLVGALGVYLFTKGGKSGALAAFAVANFSIQMLLGSLIGAAERLQSEQTLTSIEYMKSEVNKQFLLKRYKKGLGLE